MKLAISPRPLCGTLTLCGVLLLLFTSCGEDRTHEYEELTARDHWMIDVMRQQYLWGSSIQDLAWKDYFNDATTFFGKLTKQAPVTDLWSWCAIDTLSTDHHERGYFNHLDSYGLDFAILTDPTGETSRQYARILTVMDGSPASSCGLERGIFVSAIDGTKFSTTEAAKLKSGKAHTLSLARLGIDEEGTTLIWLEEWEVEMPASTWVEDRAFPVHTILDTEQGRVGYLMANRLTFGPVEHDASSTAYVDDLHHVMATFTGKNLDAFVLDLRLCNDGQLDMARLLASYLVGEEGRSQVFAKTLYNESRTGENSIYYYDDKCIGKSFISKYIYIITASYTQGAAEWLIRALRHTLGDDTVRLFGKKTAGQIVTTGTIPSDYYVTLHPAVAYVTDADGGYAYSDGLAPDYEVNESSSVFLLPYGTVDEIVLSTVLLDLAVE